MNKILLLPDNELNNVLREFVMIERLPKIGDYVYITKINGEQVSEVAKIIKYNDMQNETHIRARTDKIYTILASYVINRKIFGNDILSMGSAKDNFVIVEPTNIIIVGNKRYKMVNREALVDEKIIIVNKKFPNDNYSIGDVLIVEAKDENGIYNKTASSDFNPDGLISSKDYVVLEEVDKENIEISLLVEDVFVNLKDFIKKKLKYSNEIIKLYEFVDIKDLPAWSGLEIGRWKGRASAFEDILDYIEELEKKVLDKYY